MLTLKNTFFFNRPYRGLVPWVSRCLVGRKPHKFKRNSRPQASDFKCKRVSRPQGFRSKRLEATMISKETRGHKYFKWNSGPQGFQNRLGGTRTSKETRGDKDFKIDSGTQGHQKSLGLTLKKHYSGSTRRYFFRCFFFYFDNFPLSFHVFCHHMLYFYFSVSFCFLMCYFFIILYLLL